MKPVIAVTAFSALLLSAAAAFSQKEPAWQKSYTVTGKPTLSLRVSDSNLNILSCGGCTTVHIRITAPNRNLADYTIDETQSGSNIQFSLKEKAPNGPHLNIHETWSPAVQVEVETPPSLTLNARTADGILSASGLTGDLTFQSSDGNQELADLSGDLKLSSSDGHLQLRNARGILNAQTSDGNLSVNGSFTSLQLHSTDGSIHVELAKDSSLSASSRIETADGSIYLRVPKAFTAEFEINASDGKIVSNLPLAVHDETAGTRSRHTIHGTLNGGGALLTIRTSNGNVRLTTL